MWAVLYFLVHANILTDSGIHKTSYTSLIGLFSIST